jgi:hypothetical protein
MVLIKYSNFNSGLEPTVKKVNYDWKLNLGEIALKSLSVSRSSTVNDFYVLTEENLFVITSSGTIKSQKNFDY